MSKHFGDNAERLDNNGQKDEKGLFEEMIHQAINDEWESLFRNVTLFIKKLHLATNNEAAKQLAQDVLQDAVVIALEKASDYNPAKPIKRWLFYIAFNCIRHQRRKRFTEQRHIMLVSDAVSDLQRTSNSVHDLTEEEMFALLSKHQNSDTNNLPSIEEMLLLITGKDNEILRLAFVDELEGKELAASLGISEGAARVRLFRSIARLREAYLGSELSRKKE